MNATQTNTQSQLQSTPINRTVLMSGAEYFGDDNAINDLMDAKVPVNIDQAKIEHSSIKRAFEESGVTVKTVPAPPGCQDGVYTANWALVRSGKALMSRLPNKRSPEEPYALQSIKDLGLQPVLLPEHVRRFSGQGDALPCGDVLFTQSPYRTTLEAHEQIKQILGFREVISLQTKPARHFGFGPARRNKLTGLPDSPTYDIDLALAVLKYPSEGQKGLIAFCPSAFKRSSRQLLRSYDGVDKIEVSKKEALQAFALNLVSTGETVIMNSGAPQFQAALEARGLTTKPLSLPELKKGGGSIRCSTLTLDN
jgi:N-dimethylarginine dimethylaminohydrolase